jgi:ornithine carbamoyltransferase
MPKWGAPVHGDATRGRAPPPLADWRVGESWFDAARRDCHFMHCLPVRRNVAVADEVLDGPRSRVIQEAANRMVVQMAVLYRLLKG